MEFISPNNFFWEKYRPSSDSKKLNYNNNNGPMRTLFGGLLNTRVITRILGYMKHWSISSPFQKEIHTGIFAVMGRNAVRERPGTADDDTGRKR